MPGKDIVPCLKAKPENAVLSTSHIIVEIIEYVPGSVLIKTVIKKSAGNISVMAMDAGVGLTEKVSPFDTCVQVIEGMAELVIDRETHRLQHGMGIIIPAHASNHVIPGGRFTMILTIIKSEVN